MSGLYPERLHASPDDSSEVRTSIDQFFDAVLNHLGYQDEQRAAFCEVHSRTIAIEESSPAVAGQLSDDRLTELLVHSRLVATVLEIRGDSNHVEVLFGNHLTPELEAQLRAL